jgi:hypothetical protein
MIANLGGVPLRIAPSQVSWGYNLDICTIPTVGGRVVQVLGATMGDMTVRGLYGQDRGSNPRESWQLAEEFQQRIAELADKQGQMPTLAQISGQDPTPMHPTHRFVYNDDTPENRAQGLPVHDWDFNVYIKSLRDLTSPDMVVQHTTGKFSYGYTLTLFIVQDNTGRLAEVAKNEFIERLANGLGWQKTPYNGHMTLADLQAYLGKNSPDGTIHGLILKQFQTASTGTLPGYGTATNPIPGGTSAIGGLGGN